MENTNRNNPPTPEGLRRVSVVSVQLGCPSPFLCTSLCFSASLCIVVFGAPASRSPAVRCGIQIFHEGPHSGRCFYYAYRGGIGG